MIGHCCEMAKHLVVPLVHMCCWCMLYQVQLTNYQTGLAHQFGVPIHTIYAFANKEVATEPTTHSQ